jgi:hypothetical protein
MALARVVSFEGVTPDRMAHLKNEIESGDPPEGMPPAELLILHDVDAERSLAIVIVDNEGDYQKAHEILESMPGPDTPGTRSAVTKYDVAVRSNA